MGKYIVQPFKSLLEQPINFVDASETLEKLPLGGKKEKKTKVSYMLAIAQTLR